VLPFTNMSGDPEQEYFADGITEDIITDCSKISGLFVIARNSTFTFKKQNVDIKDVGAKLGVRHVLEGSVRRHGMRVRINVQLIDAESGGHVWADRYDRDLEDIFLVQDEVTRKIVETLEVRLTGNEEARRHDRGKVNVEAYDYLIRAKSCILHFTEPALVETREMLERALAIEPELALAYAYLAIARGVEYANAWNGRTADDLEENLAIARKACELDPAEPLSYHAMSNALMWLRRLDEAERAARKSVALDPNSAQSHGTLGIILDFSGRHEESIESLAKALRLDPEFSLWRHAQGRAQFALGHDAEAEVSFKRRLIQMPGSDALRPRRPPRRGRPDLARADGAESRLHDRAHAARPALHQPRAARALRDGPAQGRAGALNRHGGPTGQDTVPAPTSISHGPSNPSAVSKPRSASSIASQVRARSSSLNPIIIWCRAPKDSRSKRTHSAALGSRTGEGTLRTSISRRPAFANAASSTPSPPSEKGPGCPGSGGGSPARSRMIFTGIEKKALRSGVEYTTADTRPPGRSARRMPASARCWSGK
jgi:TolB-like protein/Tfp pilus assembly protein PilF